MSIDERTSLFLPPEPLHVKFEGIVIMRLDWWALIGLLLTSLGCAYGSYTAIFNPEELSRTVVTTTNLRIDTVALVSFLSSGVILFAERTLILLRAEPSRRGSRSSTSPRWRTFADAASLSLAIHAAAGAAYIGANYLVHPQTMQLPLTHFLSRPTEAEFGMSAACLAACATAIWLTIRRKGEVPYCEPRPSE